VKAKANQMLNDLNDAQLQRLTELVQVDTVCPMLAAQAAFRVVRAVFGAAGNQAAVILDRLPADPRIHASVVGQVSQAITQFKGRRAPREIAPLLDLLRETLLFGAPAVDCACEIAGEVLGAAFAPEREAFVRGLQAERMGEPVVARLHGMIHEVVDTALVEKLLGRLENDGLFKGALKRG
jgi:hypothetical protein